ncbi:MAG: HlyC/CorC family transporter [Deltaproteobacteria bacterium CG_4_8_14_3_um_filter_45_9]|jgi:putative hemolysin|nr:MAG: HlyC/CorC family transporter [Deltaproteobacteria bacterium CG03_land_8_20_14_0_80_45_14]PIX21140.1 MAG: HlyC/CorC family transporter [Deltaproteobacteria bacterium CG_4_8_14_3_um_filter_45_9]
MGEMFLIAILILLSGYLAGTEIAVVAARKIHIKQMAENGRKNAKILLNLKEDPDRFLATIQIGITLMGVLASAIGGATSVKVIQPFLKEIPIRAVSLAAEPIAIGIVVIIITYFSMIFGELVPKSIALMHPETVGLWTAKSINTFSKVVSIFVKFLTFSTSIVLIPFGRKLFTERAYITEEEVKMLIKEGRKHGVFEPTEERILQSVFEFTDMSVKEVMIPDTQMVMIQIDKSVQEIVSLIEEEQFSRYPVFGREPNDIRGTLYAKEFLTTLAKTGQVDIRKIIKPPYFIPETMKISLLLREMQKKRIHMALVVDEYGGISGLVSLEDLIEEIVGEIRDEYDIESPVIQLSDGTMLIDASINLRDLKEDYHVPLPESPEYETLGGFLMTTLQKIPQAGDMVEIEGKRIKIVEMVGKRISKVKLEKLPELAPEEA